jgi:hypothetical protein
MKPTEELFHLTEDRYEMTNVAADPTHGGVLAKLRADYDVQLAAIQRQFVPQHAYDHYPVVFSRTAPWDQKAGLLGQLKVKSGAGDDEPSDQPKKKRKTAK